MSRHRWEKLAEHRYVCTRCGLEKRNVRCQSGWMALWVRDGQEGGGSTPPCPGAPQAAPGRLPKADWCASQWNAYVEAGATLQERRGRLAEVPQEWRESVRAHVALVFQLRHAARERARSRHTSKGAR